MTSTGSFKIDGAERVRDQIAALCWRKGDGGTEVLLITSRDTGRWVIPKGWPMRGLTDAEAAAREAFEEAGVSGHLGLQGLGAFGYDKVLGDRRSRKPRVVPCLVAVFPLRVDVQTDRFPEAGERRRIWFLQSEAAKLVAEPDLCRIIAGFEPGSVTAAAAAVIGTAPG